MLSNKIMYNLERFWKFILLSMLIVVSSVVYALKSDDQQDMRIDADHVTLDYKNQVTVFTGMVVVTRGSFVVHADKGVTSLDKSGQKLVTLYGSPVTFVQLQDDGDKVEGQGNQFDYSTGTNLAILAGRARIKKGKSIIIGDKITYNTESQVYNAAGSPANGVSRQKSGRVTVILDQAHIKADQSNTNQLKPDNSTEKLTNLPVGAKK
jgi:lipopolysaccharide export system protein LptA